MKKEFFYHALLISLSAIALVSCDKKDEGLTPQQPATSLAISGVNPAAGPEGSKVVITGTGFSGTASSNTVKFGIVAAVVDSATTTRLVTKVPKDAKTGKISVEVNGKTVTSSADFTVMANPPVLGGSATNTSSAITSTTANVSSSITSKGDVAITGHGHVWSKTNNPPTLADSHTELGAIPDKATFPYKVEASLKELEANTTYFVRMYITVGSTTVYGEVFQIKTTGPVAAAISFTTQQQDILGITGSTIDIRTFIFAPEGTKLTLYGHVYSSTVSPPTTDQDRTLFTTATIGKDLFSYTSKITALKGNTKYNVRPYAIVDGKTYYGNGWTITTTEQFVNILSLTKKADFPGNTDTYGNISFVKDGKIYVADGKYTKTGYKYNYKFYEYDPASNAWSMAFDYNSGPSLSGNECSAYYNKKWYYFSSETLSEYDFDTKTVTSKEITGAGFGGSGNVSFTVIGGKIYFTKNEGLWVLDLEAKTITKLNTIPFDRSIDGLTNANGKLYLAGSGNNTNESYTILYEYDITANSWTRKTDATASNSLKYKTYRFEYIKGTGSKIYGFNIWGIGEYNPASNSWKKAYISTLAEEVLEGSIRQVIGDKVYLGIGRDNKRLVEIDTQ